MISNFDTTEESGITIALSGYLSGDLLSFWRTFIELQAKLPVSKVAAKIVTHSLNPELADLIELVYAPQASEYDDNEKLYANILRNIDLRDFDIPKDNLVESVLKNESLRSVLCNSYSRASATRLIDKLPAKKYQVLIVYWDLRDSGSAQLSQIIADTSLPVDYLYLSYSYDVDMGYSDGWILAPWELARHFGSFDQFTLDAFAGRNGYLELFSKTGWPRAQRKPRSEKFLAFLFGYMQCGIASKIVQDIFKSVEGNLKGDNFFRKIIRRFLRPIHLILTQPPITAENSCLPDLQHSPTIFSRDLALDIRPLLKYFTLSNGLRDRMRFLNKEDFATASQSGQVINPQQVILVVFEGGDLSSQLFSKSPLPLAAVYQMTNGLVYEYLPDSLGNWSASALKPLKNSFKDQMVCMLGAAEDHVNGSLPLLIIPNLNYYFKCIDWFYLNALMKYITWRGLDYVALDSELVGKPHLEFPNLHVVQISTFSLFPSAGSVVGIWKLLDKANSQSTFDYVCKSSIPLEFPVVSKEGGLFERFESVKN